MEDDMSNASINRELAALKRMFHLGAECTPPKVAMVPHIPMLKELNVRKGFFEHGEYLAVKETSPDYLKPIIAFGYHSGWRRTEILDLTWDRVDLREGIVRLDPGETKNEEGRTNHLNEELMSEFKALLSKRRPDCPYVFHRDGRPIRDFRGAWDSACIKAGLFEVVKDENGNESNKPSKTFHDFRRTAIRDMIRSGVSERVAMKISGHKTRSVFDRYNIVSDQDLKEATIKKQAYHQNQAIDVD
jgi:integrase